MAVPWANYRCPIIGMNPNWNSVVKTKFCWKTAIAESLGGYERRLPCYARPLLKTSFHLTNIDAKSSSYIRKLIDSRNETPVGVPIWMDECTILAEPRLSGSANIIEVNARNRLFQWFKYALLWTDDLDYEVVEITAICEARSNSPIVGTVTKDFVMISSLPERTHIEGAKLAPLAFGKLVNPDSKFKTGDVSELDIEFEENLGWIGTDTTNKMFLTGGGPSQLGGKNINTDEFLFEPNWTSDVVQGLIDDIEYEPFDRGRAIPRTFASKKRRTFAFSYFADRYQLQEIIKFFDYNDGRCKSFYIPTWTHDYTVTQAIEANDIAIPIERTGLSKMQDSYNGIYELTHDGVGTRIDGQETVQDICKDIFIPIDPVTDPLKPGTELCGAAKVRLEDDEIEITSKTPDAHTFELSFIETPNETTNKQDDEFQATIKNYKYAWIYKIHRLESSRVFIDWPTQTNVSGIDGISTAQAGDIHHTGIELNEDSLAKEVEIEVAGEAADYILSDVESPIDITIYSAVMVRNGTGGYADASYFFEGRLDNMNVSDRTIQATLSSTLRILTQKAPNIIVQRKCNNIFCSANCGIKKSFIVRRGSGSVTIPTILNGNFTMTDVEFDIAEEMLDSFWAGAKLIVSHPASQSAVGLPAMSSGIITRVYRGENNSLCFNYSGEADGRYKLADEENPSVNETGGCRFTLYPICCRTIGSCQLFNNHVNFCGFPWLPNNNPLESLEIDYDARGKK